MRLGFFLSYLSLWQSTFINVSQGTAESNYKMRLWMVRCLYINAISMGTGWYERMPLLNRTCTVLARSQIAICCRKAPFVEMSLRFTVVLHYCSTWLLTIPESTSTLISWERWELPKINLVQTSISVHLVACMWPW